MCGIAGILSCSPMELEARIQPILDAQRHRGPDAWGSWADRSCVLGHRRLAIIDLSEAGRQPLSNEDSTVWITFNGEIYNFQSLRAELEGLGHHFRTRTDTEAIVHAYEQWGTDCVPRLRGMFAFGIWDQRRRRLFLARDRVGKKPLFYAVAGDRFWFASELQGLLADSDLSREPDLEGIDSYLSWGYIPGPRTAFRAIRKLLPAHWLTLDLSGDHLTIRTERYWSLPYEPKLPFSEAEAGEALREKLTEAVRLRMISDVPLGAFLSGGIDSSIVVGLMARLADQPVRTFSIGFHESAYNELDHARRVAERWGTQHQEFIVQPDALAVLPQLVRHYGEPYADSSAIPTFYVSQLTRQEVTVALNGDGGDENFAGYPRYLGTRIAERIRRTPGSRLAAGTLARLLPDSIDPQNRLRHAHRFLAVAHRPMAERYMGWVGFFTAEAKQELYSPELRSELAGSSPEDWMAALFAEIGSLEPVDAVMALDIQSYLPYDLLVKVDITSMANSLEARSPFLDHEVMELAARLPPKMKLRGRSSKYLLKQAFADLLPPENVHRRKMGFGVPVGQWMRGPLRELLCDTLLSPHSRDRGWFQAAEVRRLVSEHIDRQADHSFPLWNLLMLELWQREFLDTAPPAIPRGPLTLSAGRQEPSPLSRLLPGDGSPAEGLAPERARDAPAPSSARRIARHHHGQARAALFGSVGRCGLNRLARLAQRNRLLLLSYHGISDGEPDVPDTAGLHMPIQLFEQQIRFLLRHYQPVTLAQVRAHWLEGCPLPARAILVTFDDGYRNVARNALPFLRRMGVPSVLFPVAAAVETGTWLWPSELEWQRAGEPGFRQLKRSLKALPAPERRRRLQYELVELEARPDCDYSLLTWEELAAELRSGSVEIGSHGLNHEPMTTCGPAELGAELFESKRLILERLEVVVDTVAYPNGDCSPAVVAAAEECGYRLGFTTTERHTRRSDPPLMLPRIPIDRHDTVPVLASRLSGWEEWLRGL